MKGLTNSRKTFGVLAAVGLLALPATADFTPVGPGGGSEPDLTGVGGILDTLYGWGNLQRIHDFNAPITDQIWFNPDGSAEAQAKYAGFTQDFGVIGGAAGGSFSFMFSVAADGYLGGVPSALIPVSGLLRFADDPSGAPLWSSKQSENPDGLDHMVTWLITGGSSAGKHVIAFEDYDGGGDHDYNDLVVEVDILPIPAPGAVLLGAIGLGAVAGVRRRV